MRKLIPAVVFAASAAVSAPACPIGSFSAVDNLGNQICQTLDIGQTTTENCPIGTYPWVDNWGYKVCPGRHNRRAVSRCIRRLSHRDLSM